MFSPQTKWSLPDFSCYLHHHWIMVSHSICFYGKHWQSLSKQCKFLFMNAPFPSQVHSDQISILLFFPTLHPYFPSWSCFNYLHQLDEQVIISNLPWFRWLLLNEHQVAANIYVINSCSKIVAWLLLNFSTGSIPFSHTSFPCPHHSLSTSPPDDFLDLTGHTPDRCSSSFLLLVLLSTPLILL